MILPHFIASKHYFRLRSCGWKYQLVDDVSIRSHVPIPNASFQDANGREWMRWDKGMIVIREGYAWNGNSFAVDTKRNLLASLFHDALYQFSGCAGFSMSRDECDLLFLGVNRSSGFMLAGTYYSAVKQFGGMFWGKNKGEKMIPLWLT